MASSTTIPKTKINVKRDNIFIDTSKIGINQNPPIKDIEFPMKPKKLILVLKIMPKLYH